MSSEASHVELERQLSTLTILQSVYCMDGEFVLPEDTAKLLEAFSEGEEVSGSSGSSSLLQATLNIPLEDAAAASRMIGLHISWNASKDKPVQMHKQEVMHLRLVRPDWLLKKSFEQLSATFEEQLAKLPEADLEDEVALVASAVELAKELSMQAASSMSKSDKGNGLTGDFPPSDGLV